MRKKSLYATIAFIISIAIFQSFAAWAAPGLINYQGKVTDADGFPLNGGYDMAFSLYTVATGGTSLWSETQPGVQIADGFFNIHLGAQGSLPDSLFNNDALYLEITISGETLSPRQRLTSTPYSMNANTMRVVHANGSRSSYGIDSIIPIGVINPFYGNPATLADNWKVCDGSVVDDVESPLYGKILPDLREKFIRGEAESSLNILDNVAKGGADSHTHTASHSHSINNDGDHSHTGTTANGGVNHSHDFNGNTGEPSPPGSCNNWDCIPVPESVPVWSEDERASVRHYHAFSGTTGGASAYLHAHNFGTSANGPHNHGGMTGEALSRTEATSHLPRYVALHYIIRIK